MNFTHYSNIVTQPLPIPISYPSIFKPEVQVNGLVPQSDKKVQPRTQANVASVPSMSNIQNTKQMRNLVEHHLSMLKKYNPTKSHEYNMSTVRFDEIVECLESLEEDYSQ